MQGNFPDPTRRTPVILPDGSAHPGTVFLSEAVTHPNFHAGEYSYASDFDPPDDWATRLAPYLFPGATEHLHIGRFCQIAHGVRFITSGANHSTAGLSCYPFPIFDPSTLVTFHPDTRDTHVGHDVWIGHGAMICPGALIGHGALIGAGAVVRGSIPPYAIVIGNPGSVTGYRLPDTQIATMLALAWWDWPAERIAAARPALMSGDVESLKTHAP